MSTKLHLPPEMVRHLRIGLHSELGGAAEAVRAVTLQPGREEHPGWYLGPLQRFDASRLLLNTIGWATGPPGVSRTIYLPPHHEALLAALQSQLSVERDARQVGEDEDERRARTKRVLALYEFISTIEPEAESDGWS